MIRKITLLSACVAMLAVSCSKDDNNNDTKTPATGNSLEQQIAEITGKPYSTLPPEQQKVKLETEANAMVSQMDAMKTSESPEVLSNLSDLLDMGTIDFLADANGRRSAELFQVSDVYGIYTWNETEMDWTKTESSSELKFLFPANNESTTNNAVLSLTSTSSTIKQTNGDTEFYLPASVNATLKVNGIDAVTIAVTSKYAGENNIPTESTFKVTLSEGYVLSLSTTKGALNTANASLTYNNKNIIDFANNYSGNIDAIIKDEDTGVNLGTGNSLIKLMDNFAITAAVNAEGLKNDQEAAEKAYPQPEWSNDNVAYTAALNNYYKMSSAASVAANNNNIKAYLVSRKDGTKIAQVFMKSVKGYSYESYEGGTIQYYDEVQYLRFNDNTEVEMSVYFSEGFDSVVDKIENFIQD